MANLQAVLDENAFGGLDDTLKTFYTQNAENKSFYLNLSADDAGKLAFNLQADLKKKEDLLKRAHDEKNELKSKFTPFESLGKTADEIKAALEANRPEEVTKLVTDYELKLKSIEDSYKESLQKESELRTKAQSALEKTLVDSTISKLRADFDLNDAAPFVLQNFIRPVRNEETGEISTVIFENGNPALVAGQPKTPEQLLNGFKEAKQFLSIFNAGSEGGSGGTNRQTQFNGNKSLEGLSGTEKLKAARQMQK